ncbi:phosphoribosyl transferase [Corynebacterium diphtheriae bv. mitis]|nr:phosphoribosyl transferase [Corynebacterium diphtheriae bv. mitis]
MYAVCKKTGYRSEQALWEKESMRDSVGLDVAARRRNVMGKVELVSRPSRPVLLVDDVVTTGATIAESVAVLTSAGVKVRELWVG